MDVDDRPVGLSVWESELYEFLMNHVKSESDVLDRYEDLAEQSTGHVRFLLELIAEDEARHHRLFEQWAQTIKGMGAWMEAPDGVPDLVHEPDPAGLIAAVEDLLEVEEQDVHELKELEKKLKDVRRTTVWPLLAELMASDTRKHIMILEFLRDHAKKTAHNG